MEFHFMTSRSSNHIYYGLYSFENLLCSDTFLCRMNRSGAQFVTIRISLIFLYTVSY